MNTTKRRLDPLGRSVALWQACLIAVCTLLACTGSRRAIVDTSSPLRGEAAQAPALAHPPEAEPASKHDDAESAPTADAPAEAPQAERAEPLQLDVSLRRRLSCAGSASLERIAGRALLVCGNAVMQLEDGHFTTLTRLELPSDGFYAPVLTAVAGTALDDLWLAVSAPVEDANGMEARFYHFDGKRLTLRAGRLSGTGASRVAAWDRGRALGFLQSPPGSAHWVPLHSEASAPWLPPALTPGGPERDPFCRVQLRAAEAMASLGIRSVLLASGQLCRTEPSATGEAKVKSLALGVEHVRAGKAQGSVVMLPVPRERAAGYLWEVMKIVAPMEGRAVLAAHAFGFAGEPPVTALFEFDGRGWTAAPSPAPGVLEGLWPGEGDGLWAADAEGRIWRRAGQRWTAVSVNLELTKQRLVTLLETQDEIWWVVRAPREAEESLQLYRTALKSSR